MASIRLIFPPSTQFKMLLEAVDMLYDVQLRLSRVSGSMSMAVRSQQALVDADFYPLCEELGVDIARVEDVKTLFYLVSSVNTKVTDPVIQEFQKQCDQG